MTDNGVLNALIDTAKEVVAEGQCSDDWPKDETISLVVSVRPDGHGRAAAIAIDLLQADEDHWDTQGHRVLHACYR